MRKSILTLSFLVAFAFLILQPVLGAQQTGKILINISGLRNDKGVVRVALFNSESAYKAAKSNEGENAFRKTTAEIKDKSASCELADVPYGEYAIKFFHDEDNSGKFITGMFGIPKVEFGFSNNATGMFGPASFDKAKFVLNSTELTLNLKSQSK